MDTGVRHLEVACFKANSSWISLLLLLLLLL